MPRDGECLCGHLFEEHAVHGPCQVDDCTCFEFRGDVDVAGDEE